MVKRSLLLIAVLAASSAAVMAGDDQASEVTFVVLKDYNGKPVRNASIVLHPVDKNGKQKRAGQQLKTNAEGRTEYPGIPYGKVRVQVIAPNFQTYGQDYEINQPTMEIVVKLKRPQEQHSIYNEPKKEGSPN
jgi:5-hydroxyisourate hydrolase-like protein (transthyretin family)